MRFYVKCWWGLATYWGLRLRFQYCTCVAQRTMPTMALWFGVAAGAAVTQGSRTRKLCSLVSTGQRKSPICTKGPWCSSPAQQFHIFMKHDFIYKA
jgi:hypothetical protein